MRSERDTAQKRAIRRVFDEEPGRPLSPEEVLQAARSHAPSLGIATVYRNLKMLVEENWLDPVSLPGETDRYERAGKSHHHHFQCSYCTRVFDVPGCPGQVQKLAPKGFSVERHDLTLYGRCPDCSPLQS